MNSDYREDDGMDPGLGEMSYDGAEYEMDEFGERIGSEDDFERDLAAEEELDAADDGAAMRSTDPVENGFGETLKPEHDPVINEQLEDPELHEKAKTDYSEDGMSGDSVSGDPAREDRSM